MQLLTLDCGRKVWLDAFDYSRTYAGLLEGVPDAEMNRLIIERALVNKLWGPRKAYLIPPEVDAHDAKHPVLPPALLRAWLWCSEPIHPAFMGSHLVVVWFAGECLNEPIADVVFRAVRRLPWDQLADDFDW